MKYGHKRDYPKIDIFIKTDSNKWLYHSSTTWSKTCKEAVQEFELRWNNLAIKSVKANFAKD